MTRPVRSRSAGPPIRVAVLGRGRLGGFAARLLESAADLQLVACWSSADDWPALLNDAHVAVALEATVAGRGEAHARVLLEAGVRPVVATSGVDPEAAARLDVLARAGGLGGVVVPNFSLGALLMQRAAESIAPHLPDVEIVELHHAGKRDAPSATALDTARRIEAARSASRTTAPVPIHSVRLPGLHAHHEVLFGGAGETVTLRHDVQGPEAFGPGLLLALRHAATARGVAYGLECLLDAS